MKTIIAGVDFTKSSYNAAKYAAMLAEKLHCKLVLFNMYDVPLIHSNSGLYFMSYTSIRDTSENNLKRFLSKLKREHAKLEIGCFVTTGSFRAEISSFIKKHQVQYVVMGLVTKNKFSKFLYGSHSTDLAGKLKSPVIIVPEQYKEHQLKKVLIGVDNSEKLHRSPLKNIGDFIKTTHAGLHVLHIRTEEELFDHNKIRDIKVNNKKYPIEILPESSIERGMKKYSLQNKVDLIGILSKKHSAFYNLFLESNTKSIAFASKVPVMAIHE